MIVEWYITDFSYFCIGLRQLFPRHTKKKKRYAYLVLENVGNFQLDASIAWAAIVTSASMVSYDLQVKNVAYSSTLEPMIICYCVENQIYLSGTI